MKKETFESIRDKGLLLYEYIRGSVSQGCNTETSDEDHGGVYLSPIENLIDLGFDYQDQIDSDKHDDVWYDLNKFMRLLLKSNPTMLESLFIDDEHVLYEHPIMTEIKKHRDKFITKECFKPMFQFAKSQIEKMQGLNKKINWDISEMVRKTPLDFCHTFDDKQGSKPIMEWLEERGLEQRNCGLVNIPNMPGMYGVYYDYGQHMKLNNIDKEYFCDETNFDNGDKFIQYMYRTHASEWNKDNMSYDFTMEELYEDIKTPIGKHCGIISPDGDSNEIRFSETKKGDRPICFMSYGENGYRQHCKKYKEYEDWKKNRNKVRYESNLNKKYDSKNAAHCMRLINMCIEVASGKGFNVNRTNIDRNLLLDIRNHKYEYEDLMKILKEKENEANIAIEKSTLPDTIDIDFVNNLLVDIRKKQLKELL